MKKIYKVMIVMFLSMIGVITAFAQINRVTFDMKADSFYYNIVLSTKDSLSTKGPGWKLNWQYNDNVSWKAACTVDANTKEIVVKPGNTGTRSKRDDGVFYATSYSFAITTQVLRQNTQDYPFIAFKFAKLPTFSDTGLTEMRYQAIVRAASMSDGKNHDWYGVIDPKEITDAAYCTHYEDDVCGGGAYLFQYATMPGRAITTKDMIIPTSTNVASDIVIYAYGLKSDTTTAKLSWVKSFKSKADFESFYTSKQNGCKTTAVKIIEQNKVKVSVSNGIITVLNVKVGSKVEIFNLLGSPIYSGLATSTSVSVAAPKGIVYIIRNEDQVAKIFNN